MDEAALRHELDHQAQRIGYFLARLVEAGLSRPEALYFVTQWTIACLVRPAGSGKPA